MKSNIQRILNRHGRIDIKVSGSAVFETFGELITEALKNAIIKVSKELEVELKLSRREKNILIGMIASFVADRIDYDELAKRLSAKLERLLDQRKFKEMLLEKLVERLANDDKFIDMVTLRVVEKIIERHRGR